MAELTLYTRPGCHLCDIMKSVIVQVGLKHPIGLTEINISSQPDLEDKFSNDIPVLLCGDRVLARHRISISQLITQLTGSSVAPRKTKKSGSELSSSSPPDLNYFNK